MATTTDAMGAGNVTTTAYDELNNASGIILPTGAATQALYAQGPDCQNAQSGHPYLPKCVIDDSGNSQEYTYDDAGNLTEVTDTTSGGTGASFSYTYENADGTVCGGQPGQICTATDGNDNLTSYSYTGGNLTTVTPPAPLGPTIYTYDTIGRVTTVTDDNGHTTSYGYDAANRITRTTFDNGQRLTTVYNPDGTIASEIDSAGTTINYTYNLLGKQTEQEVITAAWRGADHTSTMAYDANGNMTQHNGTTYTYDAANQLIRILEAGGSCSTSGDPAPRSGCTLLTYDDNGAEASRIFPGGARQDTVRDTSGRIVRITAGPVDIEYSYTDGDSDRMLVQTRTSHSEEGIPAGAVTTYSYDSLQRLTGAGEQVGGIVNASWAYTYDQAGNRTSQTRTGDTGATGGTITYSYNAANQIISSSADTANWAYDGAGNQTRNGITGAVSSYGDRLQVTANATIAYETFGQGNATQLQSGNYAYQISPLGLTGRSDHLGTEHWTRDPTGRAVSYQIEPYGGRPEQHGNFYYVTDHLGSVVGLFDETGRWNGGYSYSPYGERRFNQGSYSNGMNPLRYIGGHEESDNLYKFGARYYDSTLGRFTQMDPTGQELGPYAYGRNSPSNYIDPVGLNAGCGLSLAGGALATAGLIGGILSGGVGFGIALATYGIATVSVGEACYEDPWSYP